MDNNINVHFHAFFLHINELISSWHMISRDNPINVLKGRHSSIYQEKTGY